MDQNFPKKFPQYLMDYAKRPLWQHLLKEHLSFLWHPFIHIYISIVSNNPRTCGQLWEVETQASHLVHRVLDPSNFHLGRNMLSLSLSIFSSICGNFCHLPGTGIWRVLGDTNMCQRSDQKTWEAHDTASSRQLLRDTSWIPIVQGSKISSCTISVGRALQRRGSQFDGGPLNLLP